MPNPKILHLELLPDDDHFVIHDANSPNGRLGYSDRNDAIRSLSKIFGRTAVSSDQYGGVKIQHQLFPALFSLSKADEREVSSEVQVEKTQREEVTPVQVDMEVVDRRVKFRVEQVLNNIRSQLSAGIPMDESNEVVDRLPVEQIIASVRDTILKQAHDEFQQRANEGRYKKRQVVTDEVTHEVPALTFKWTEEQLQINVTHGASAEFIKKLLPYFDHIAQRRSDLKRWRNIETLGGVREDEKNYAPVSIYEPRDYQWSLFKMHTTFAKTRDLSDMGVGKTLAMLMAIDWRIQQGHIRPGHILIVGPKTVIEKWCHDQIPSHVPHLRGQVLSGSFSQRVNQVLNNDKRPAEERADIFLINYEAFAMKQEVEGQDLAAMAALGIIPFADVQAVINEKGAKAKLKVPFARLFKMHEWDLVCLDEAHKIKNPAAQRTFALIDAFCEAPYRHILTGTINANTMADVHMPNVFLDRAKDFNPIQYKGEIRERKYTIKGENGDNETLRVTRTGIAPLAYSTLFDHFAGSYFHSSGFKKIPKHGAIDEIRARFEEAGMRFEKSDCLTLPPKNYDVRMLDLHPTHLQFYKALESKLIVDLNDIIGKGGRITMMNILAMMVKLREAANGWIRDNEGNDVTFPWNAKLDALVEIMDEIRDDEKVVIWGTFTHDLHQIASTLRAIYGHDEVAVIHGQRCSECGSDPATRFDTIQQFLKRDERPRIMVLNVDVGSHGIDLTSASYAIFFSNSFTKTNRKQGEDRLHRLGMQAHLTIIDLIARETIDETVYGALQSWQSMSSALLGHLGIDTPIEDQSEDEEPVISPMLQGPKECVLATLCMLAGKPLSAGRRWVVNNLGRASWYPYTPSDELRLREAWKLEFEDVTSMAVDDNKVWGHALDGQRGMITIKYNGREQGHRVAFYKDWVYDPSPISGSAEHVKMTMREWIGQQSSLGATIERVWTMVQRVEKVERKETTS